MRGMGNDESHEFATEQAARAAAAALGRRGGLARTKAKAEAAKRNGGAAVREGSRPRGRPRWVFKTGAL